MSQVDLHMTETCVEYRGHFGLFTALSVRYITLDNEHYLEENCSSYIFFASFMPSLALQYAHSSNIACLLLPSLATFAAELSFAQLVSSSPRNATRARRDTLASKTLKPELTTVKCFHKYVQIKNIVNTLFRKSYFA